MSSFKCGDKNSTACSRSGRTRDLNNGRISSLFLYLKLKGNAPQDSVGRFAVFLCLFLPLAVFFDDDSKIPLLICCRQLLIGHVTVALHVAVPDVHHRTFINIEIHLALVGPINKFIDTTSSVILIVAGTKMHEREIKSHLRIT